MKGFSRYQLLILKLTRAYKMYTKVQSIYTVNYSLYIHILYINRDLKEHLTTIARSKVQRIATGKQKP